MGGSGEVTPTPPHPPLSSLENLLGNIQNLLKVAAESVRHEEKQWNREKGESQRRLSGVRGLGSGVSGLGFGVGVWGPGSRVWGLGSGEGVGWGYPVLNMRSVSF